MKKHILHFLETKSLWLWLFFYLSIPALLGLSVLLTGPVRINTLLQDMLPQSVQSREAAKADNALTERNSREAVILAAAPDFESAKKGAVSLFSTFEKSTKVERLLLFFFFLCNGAAKRFFVRLPFCHNRRGNSLFTGK
jgi:hypothetical protein